MTLSTLAAALTVALSSTASAAIVGGDLTGGGAPTLGGNFVPLPSSGGFSVGHNNFNDPDLFDFNEDQNIGTRAIGDILFDADIFGIATDDNTLGASDFLINNNVTYENPSLRGLESNDSVWIDANDSKRLNIDLWAMTCVSSPWNRPCRLSRSPQAPSCCCPGLG